MSFELINEIGHELKNKLGIIGHYLHELSATPEIDIESHQDANRVYLQLVSLAKILSELKEESAKDTIERSIIRLLIEYIKSVSTEEPVSFSQYEIHVSSDSGSAFEHIQLSTIQITELKSIPTPKNGLQKILYLAISSIKKEKKIRIIILKEGMQIHEILF